MYDKMALKSTHVFTVNLVMFWQIECNLLTSPNFLTSKIFAMQMWSCMLKRIE